MIAERRFTLDDQKAFAIRAGDYNPMHLDALAARRTQAGAPVVHGMHAVLWALDELADTDLPIANLGALSVQFSKFLYIGQPISLRLRKRNHSVATAELSDSGIQATILTLGFGRSKDGGAGEFSELPEVSTASGTPNEPPFNAAGSLSGWVTPEATADAFQNIAPRLCAALGVERVICLALLSRVVGMLCPGLHSIFVGVRVKFTDDLGMRAGIGFRVSATDERFKSFSIAVAGGGMAGTISAFMRHPPVEMPRLDRVAQLLVPDEFGGSLALVIGGSRGLGALTAKLLAAGGARVVVTYARGKSEADDVAAEINVFRNSPVCKTVRFDATADLESQLTELPSGVTHLYYFATPRISRQKTNAFSQSLYDEFNLFYIHTFHAVCQHILVQSGSLSVFNPSSVFIEDRPKGMTEYSMVKAAAEVLCSDLTRTLPGLHIVTTRLPRMLTDQTATNLPLEFADPLDIMLPFIRLTQAGQCKPSGLSP